MLKPFHNTAVLWWMWSSLQALGLNPFWYFVFARWFHSPCHVTFEKTVRVGTPTPRRTTKESAIGPLAELGTPCGTQGACWETILLYMLLIRGPFHSHRTPTCPRFLIKQQQLKRVWHSKTNNQSNTSTTGFAKDKKWKFYEWATIDVIKLKLKQAWADSFVVLCLLSLIIICKTQPWQCCFYVKPEEEGGKGKMQLLMFACSQKIGWF